MSAAGKVEPGDVIGGRYEVVEKIGVGGFGAVYRAKQSGMDREVAVKTLLPHLGAVEELEERFKREASLASNLVCPHTIRMYDFGRTEDGMLFIAMELLRGRELDDYLKEGEKFDPARTRKIGMMMLQSLAEAHQQGIVHRDLKPSNIFLCEVGREKDYVKVLDFGIAKAVDKSQDEDAGKLTATGQALGTPYYMAPEQIRGEQVGPHTDIYAIGLILLEMLVGHTIMVGKTPIETVLLQVSPDPVPIPEELVNTPLGQIIGKAVDKNWQTRYQSADDMISDLERLDVSGLMGVTFTPMGPQQAQWDTGTGPYQQRQQPQAMSGPYPQQMTSGPYPQQMVSGPYPQQMGTGMMPTTGAYGYQQPEKNGLKLVLLGMLVVLVLVGAAVAFVVLQDDGNAEAKNANANAAANTNTQAPPPTEPTLNIATFNNAQTVLLASTMHGITPAVPGMAIEKERRDQERAAEGLIALVVNTEPNGAEVLRNGVYFGRTPIKADLPRGTGIETWTVKHDRYKDKSFEVDLSTGGEFTLTLEKEKSSSSSSRKSSKSSSSGKKTKKSSIPSVDEEPKKEEKKPSGSFSVD